MASTASDMSGQIDPDLISHSIAFVHIDGDKIQIECSCGWKTDKLETEADARAEFDSHVGDE